MTKIIAFYLPQFHSIPENDKWWGDGFTDWVNVKKANPLFNGHYQPRVPYLDNYYSLADVDTLHWQAKLMKDYGIDGLCFYHYWFGGVHLLGKPLSLLLENKNLDMNFCLSWANEPWSRTWDGRDKEVLMSQSYGGRADWLEHFHYLLKAFKDQRYIIVNGKPMLIIYRPSSISCLNEMLSYWNELAVQHGFDGLHIVGMNTSFNNHYDNHYFSASVDFEPMYTTAHDLGLPRRIMRSALIRLRRLANFFNAMIPEDSIKYTDIWSRILKRKITKGRYLGAFVDWDNSARKKERSLVVTGTSPELFLSFFEQQYARAVECEVDFLFVNAWNEWAEGTYLEPDSKYGFKYLESIKKAKDSI